MKYLILTLLGLTVMISSCKKNEEAKSYNATIQGKGLDCGNVFLIKFKEDVSTLTNNNLDNMWYAINLPQEYKIEGKKVIVEYRMPENDELIVCTTMGITYPQLFITKVEEPN